MDTNKLFSFQRIAMVMKRDFFENWKTNLYRFLALYGVFFFVYITNLWHLDGVNPDIRYGGVDLVISEYMGFFLSIFGFTLLGGTSFISDIFKTKEQRIANLMLPATMSEKFWGRIIYVTLGLFVMLVAAVICADLTHYLFRPLFDIDEVYQVSILLNVVGQLYEHFNPFDTYSLRMVVDGVDTTVVRNVFPNYLFSAATLSWIYSFYVLGGCRWRKWSFVKTTIALIISFCLIAWIGVEIAETLEDSVSLHQLLDFCREYLFWVNESIAAYIGSAFFLILTVLNWFLAYRSFARSQVIEPKFRLL